MTNVTVTVRRNGSHIINGVVELRDADGNVHPAKDNMALYRYGASTKQFCDGIHSKIEFQAVEQ